LYQFGVVMQNYQEAKASDQLVRELLALGDDSVVSYGDSRLTTIEKVSFDRVMFGYTPDTPILHDVSWSADQ